VDDDDYYTGCNAGMDAWHQDWFCGLLRFMDQWDWFAPGLRGRRKMTLAAGRRRLSPCLIIGLESTLDSTKSNKQHLRRARLWLHALSGFVSNGPGL
jgi:hypothetical protein